MVQVTLLDGIFQESQETGKGYLLHLDVDRLIAPCYEAASLQPKKPRYGGWESTPIAGHSVGHWLSAASAMVAATGDEALLQKLIYAVDELAYVQSHDPDGYLSGFSRDCFDRVFTGDFEVHNFGLGGSWVPWYSIHKIYAGLIDAYKLAGIEQALQAVVKLSDWAKKGTDRLTDEQFQRMLICEHGGMNEAMADLYLLTGNRAYLELAIRFCHQAILEPLARGVDELEGKHANTQIPKVIGAAKLYEITGKETYRKAAEFFWQEVTRNRSYIIGGNSIFEHFRARGTEKLGVETAETCNTYNMLKLTSHLFRWSPDAEYMDFYERALYNHILASQDPDSGMKMYFVSTEPGHFKVYGSPDQSFWCCTGTGMENPARYTHEIYHAQQDAVYVNLFIGSRAVFEDREVVIRQETDFPRTDRTRLVLEEAQDARFKLRIRIPYWAAGMVTAVVSGSETYTGSGRDYLEIERNWNAGDTIEVTLPMDLHIYRAKDDEQKVGFMYGPVVLAGALGRDRFPENDIVDNHLKLHHHPLIDVPVLVTDEPDIKKWIIPVEGSVLTFVTDPIGEPGSSRVTLIPFYALHHQRYTIYWKLMNKQEYERYTDHEKAERERLNAITVDVVSPHEQQSEVEHDIQSQESRSGYSVHAQKGYRDAVNGGYFRYRMAVMPDKPMALQVTYFGSDGVAHVDGVRMERDFEILVDGKVIARQQLKAENPDQLFDMLYDIPIELTSGKRNVEVKFESTAGKIAGGVYGIRLVDRDRMEQWEGKA
ncbi:beta-L-arabinofuranosidase domain-containing protein [Paenibacillus alkalitolerans]|uniref:beta-L-arabinofuranosidase domain-containing protein n=1 Tax=Paenibacillus alkalitolerans TaxID=2799335 RepID=UPI0018F4150C|nr:beta-L-arabinofuranosidase domain-containing protein [Paenibacillus alkalitolerans]